MRGKRVRWAAKLKAMNGILIIAHAPLASALRACALHVFPDCSDAVLALDVPPNEPPEHTLVQARALKQQLNTEGTLVLVDVFGATPCNIANKLLTSGQTKLITGVNLPMLLRAMSYRHEALDALVPRAMSGATQGIIPVAPTAPPVQHRTSSHDPVERDHQQ
ncbi:MAG: system mannose-specific component [Pseudomonadota bacterium]